MKWRLPHGWLIVDNPINTRWMLLRRGFACPCDCGCEACWPKVCELCAWVTEVCVVQSVLKWTIVYHTEPQCSTVGVVREPQKRAQDLGIKPQRGAAAVVLPSPTKWQGENLFRPLTKCLDNILPHKVLLQANCWRWRFFLFPLPTALVLNLWLLGAILAGNSIFTSPTPPAPSRTNENSLTYNSFTLLF